MGFYFPGGSCWESVLLSVLHWLYVASDDCVKEVFQFIMLAEKYVHKTNVKWRLQAEITSFEYPWRTIKQELLRFVVYRLTDWVESQSEDTIYVYIVKLEESLAIM